MRRAGGKKNPELTKFLTRSKFTRCHVNVLLTLYSVSHCFLLWRLHSIPLTEEQTYDNFEACWIIIVHHFHYQNNHLLTARKKVMGSEILQRQRVVRQRTERGMRDAEREVGGYVGTCCVCVGSDVQTDATTPAILGPAVHRGKATVRVRGGMSLRNGMWHGLRNVIYAE